MSHSRSDENLRPGFTVIVYLVTISCESLLCLKIWTILTQVQNSYNSENSKHFSNSIIDSSKQRNLTWGNSVLCISWATNINKLRTEKVCVEHGAGCGLSLLGVPYSIFTISFLIKSLTLLKSEIHWPKGGRDWAKSSSVSLSYNVRQQIKIFLK